MTTTKQLDALEALQQRWAHHEDLRAKGASIAELAVSRSALDEVRLQARRSLPRQSQHA